MKIVKMFATGMTRIFAICVVVDMATNTNEFLLLPKWVTILLFIVLCVALGEQ